ncbi:MAG: hypothetical protein LBF67_09340, partial [Prevotellaceae bacterium]|nr:hypothetical protein [Prevotellaceae bacterium]
MKRFFISLLLIFSLLGLKGNAFAQANYINGNSLTKDPVWGSSYYRYADGGDDVVTTEAELWAAITAAAANEPHIIPIATGITLSATITIPAAKNIVLRKVVVENSEPEKGSYYRAANGKYIVQKWWNFGNPWVNTNAASPDLYDGEPDYFITQPQTATFRHIIVSGSDVTLTLENITLQGNNPNTDVSVLDRAKTSPVTGGILVNETNFVFRGFIDKCADIKYEYIGPAICIAGNSNLNFKMLGGVISGCLSNIGGAIGFTQNTNNAYSIHTPNGGYTFQITGYTIIENCAAMEYGGAICFIGGTLELSGSTIIRNCKGRFGGAILFRNGGTAEIKDNVRIENCLSLAYEPKPRGNAGYSGLGGAFVTFGTPIINVRDNATFANNRAMRGGGAFFLQTKAAELNLYGGVFTGNEATGEYRELASTDAEVIRYSIGGGGAIYAYDPTVVKIPANSTVYFSGNKASSAAYIDN